MAVNSESIPGPELNNAQLALEINDDRVLAAAAAQIVLYEISNGAILAPHIRNMSAQDAIVKTFKWLLRRDEDPRAFGVKLFPGDDEAEIRGKNEVLGKFAQRLAELRGTLDG